MSLSRWLRVMNALSTSTAVLDATSPAFCPPRPSQTTKKEASWSTLGLSSLRLRRRATSVRPKLSSIRLLFLPRPGGGILSQTGEGARKVLPHDGGGRVVPPPVAGQDPFETVIQQAAQ